MACPLKICSLPRSCFPLTAHPAGHLPVRIPAAGLIEIGNERYEEIPAEMIKKAAYRALGVTYENRYCQ